MTTKAQQSCLLPHCAWSVVCARDRHINSVNLCGKRHSCTTGFKSVEFRMCFCFILHKWCSGGASNLHIYIAYRNALWWPHFCWRYADYVIQNKNSACRRLLIAILVGIEIKILVSKRIYHLHLVFVFVFLIRLYVDEAWWRMKVYLFLYSAY